MDRIWHFLARHAPRRFIYWCVIVVGANATTGEYGHQIVPDLTVFDALDRWPDNRGPAYNGLEP